MLGFTVGLATGCLVGVSGTFLLLFLAGALSGDRSGEMSELSPRKVFYAVGALLAIAVVSYGLKLEQNAAMLLLLLTVLTIARLEGIANGMLASVISALMLTFFFLPPIGSLRIPRPGDRLTLALFLLSAILGSRLIGTSKRLPAQHS